MWSHNQSLDDCMFLRLHCVLNKVKCRGEQTLYYDGFWLRGKHFNPFLPPGGKKKKTEYPHPVFFFLLNCILFHLRFSSVYIYFLNITCAVLYCFPLVQFCIVSQMPSPVLLPLPWTNLSGADLLYCILMIFEDAGVLR